MHLTHAARFFLFQPYLQKTMDQAMRGLALQTNREYELREYTMMLFSNLSKVYEVRRHRRSIYS